MPLANNALVLVTDGRKTLFFRNEGDENQIDLRTEAHEEREDLKDHEIKSDAAGSSKQSFGFGRPALGETDFHEQEKARWAKKAAEQVNQRVLANEFDALAIIAPPRTLAEVRKNLHKEAERRLVCEIPKEMTGRPIPDIEALLVGAMATEAPAEY
jgi:protein required for attachment to host cells